MALLVNIMQCVRLYIKRKYYIIATLHLVVFTFGMLGLLQVTELRFDSWCHEIEYSPELANPGGHFISVTIYLQSRNKFEARFKNKLIDPSELNLRREISNDLLSVYINTSSASPASPRLTSV